MFCSILFMETILWKDHIIKCDIRHNEKHLTLGECMCNQYWTSLGWLNSVS